MKRLSCTDDDAGTEAIISGPKKGSESLISERAPKYDD